MKMPYRLCAVLFATTFGLAQASADIVGEKQYSLGATLPSPEDFADVPLVPLTRAYIPEAIDLSDRFPAPGDQGEFGSCVSWSAGYAARSYYELANTNSESTGDNTLVSPAYLHNVLTQGKPDCADSGTDIRDALNLLQRYGGLSLQDYPIHKICSGSTRQPVRSEKFRIKTFERIANPVDAGSYRRGLRKDTLDRAKLKLADGHPILLGMVVGPTLMNLPSNKVYSESVYQTGEINLVTRAGKPKTGPHAMVITGYDDRRSAFRVLNSWGKGWADGGYAWVSYDSVLKDGIYGYVMYPVTLPPKPVPTRPTGAPPAMAEANGFSCAEFREERRSDRPNTLTGFVSTAVDEAKVGLLATSAGLSNEVYLRPWPICEAMITLREPLKAPSTPRIELAGGDRTLRVGEPFSFTITPPDFPSFLYVFYIEDDGTVVNLAPRTSLIRRQTGANAPALIFGDGKDGRPRYTVAPLKSDEVAGIPRVSGERGHEAVVVIAARSPIQELEDREDQENAGAKLYRIAASSPADDGPQDRLFLSLLKDIVFKRSEPGALPREVAASILHLRIED